MQHSTRTPARRVVGALLALLIALAGALVAQPAAAAPATSGSLDWGFKQSFRNYVPASGQQAVSPASRTEDGLWSIPAAVGDYDPGTGAIDAAFDGGMHFDFPGRFTITLSSFRVVIADGSGMLEADVRFVNAADGAESVRRVDFAALDVTRGTRTNVDGELRWSGIPARLTAAGAEAFQGYYVAGLLIDPVGFTLSGDWPTEEAGQDEFTAPGTVGHVVAWTSTLAGSYSLSAMDVHRDSDTAYTISHDIDPATYATVDRVIATDARTGTVLGELDYPGVLPEGGQIAVDQRTGAVAFPVQTDGSAAFTEDGAAANFGVVVVREGVATLTLLAASPVDIAWNESDGSIVVLLGSGATRRVEVLTPSGGHAVATRTLTLTGTVGAATNARSVLVDQTAGTVHVVLRRGATSTSDGQVYTAWLGDEGRAPIVTSTPQTSNTIHSAGLVESTGALVLPLAAGGVAVVDTRGDFAVTPAIGSAVVNRVADSPATGQIALLAGTAFTVQLLDAAGLLGGAPASTTIDDLGPLAPSRGLAGLASRSDGAIVVSGGQASVLGDASTNDGIRAIERTVAPSVTTSPSDAAITLRSVVVADDGSTIPVPAAVRLSAAGDGLPAPAIQWQMETASGWSDLVDGESVQGATSGTLSFWLSDAGETRLRAVLRSTIPQPDGTERIVGSIGTAPVTVTATVAEPEQEEPEEQPGGGAIGTDGTLTGVANASGARTAVRPGVEIAADGADLTVTGTGFSKGSNGHGLYALFGYVTRYPSQGGAAGDGYDYIPGGGTSGQDGQLFVTWPDNTATGAAANATFDGTGSASFSASGVRATTSFTGQSGATVDCLDGTVQCGVLTFGAHGGRDANLETFTPVFFVGQTIPDTITGGGTGEAPTPTPVPLAPPVVTAPPVAQPAAALAQQPVVQGALPVTAEAARTLPADSEGVLAEIAAGTIALVEPVDAGLDGEDLEEGSTIELDLAWNGEDTAGTVWAYSTPVEVGAFVVADGRATGSADLTGLEPGAHHLVLSGDAGTVVAIPITIAELEEEEVVAAAGEDDVTAQVTPISAPVASDPLWFVAAGLGGALLIVLLVGILLATGVLRLAPAKRAVGA